MGDENDSRLRGRNLDGSDQPEAADHVRFAKKRNPDAELHLDDEKDTLYSDGLDIEDDSQTLADTRGATHKG
jgi:hypothetical protein